MGLKVSVVVCTYRRPESLRRCLQSLADQTYEPFEVKIIREKGQLAELRNQGAEGAKGDILSFIDDDVLLPSTWMEAVVATFTGRPSIGGVSGPAVIPLANRRQRDLFRWPWIKKAYDALFLEGKANLPGHLTRSGTWTTGAYQAACDYQGDVDFLEACNMSWRTSVFKEVGGFDENYLGIGDWSEPDLACRVRKAGYQLWFTPKAKLTHLPDRTGAYLSRAQTGARYSNYQRFSKKWVKPCLRNDLYKLFLKSYFLFKQISGHWQTAC